MSYALAVALLLLASCAQPAVPVESSAVPASAGPAGTSAAPASAEPKTTIGPMGSPDLTTRPVVWFGPLPALPPGSSLPFNDGAIDYLDLWRSDAAWPLAADRVRVFSVAGTFVEHYATDTELRTIIAGVRQRGMALALEVGPLPASDSCGGGVEGFGGLNTLDQVRRIQSLGGEVDVIAFDEPFAFGHFWDGPNACGWSTERIANEVAGYVGKLRDLVPDVIVGDIEPIWSGMSADDIGGWLDAYRQAAGVPFAFLHLDPDWGLPDWPERLLASERAARARGTPVGPYYSGGEAPSDQAWVDLAMNRAYTYEQVDGGRPDDVVFGSWFDHPDHLLPESDPTTFTGLIDRYFGARTAIRPGEVSGGAGALRLSGALTTVHEDPVIGEVALEAMPLDGQAQVLSDDGIVPPDAKTALIVFRVNTEGAGPGEADLRVYNVAYTEDDASVNQVRNPRFSKGLEGWGSYGQGRATTVATDRGDGRMLRLVANADQALNIDSTAAFTVTPGATYHLSIEAAVPEASAGSAYAAVIFLADNGSEGTRQILRLEPIAVPLATVTTDATGRFEFANQGLEPGRYRLVVSYAGDLTYWPAESEPILASVSGL